MPATRLICLLASAAAAARDKDAYVADWARAGSADRCNAPDCEWMARFPAIDVGCRIIGEPLPRRLPPGLRCELAHR